MILRKSTEQDVAKLVEISKEAFDTDIMAGGTEPGGPPDYDSIFWHNQMQKEDHLYSFLTDDGKLIGGAILFEDPTSLFVGRIFIDPQCFRCGYGMMLMKQIEDTFTEVRHIRLDTPV